MTGIVGLVSPLRTGCQVNVIQTQPTSAAPRLATAAARWSTAPARLAKTTIPREVSRVDSFLCVKIHIQFLGNGDSGNITVTDGVRSDGKCGKENPQEVVVKPLLVITDGVRSDGRCGSEVPLEDGSPAICDPDSPDFCCSEYGHCGGSLEHCNCDTCINYKEEEEVNGEDTTQRPKEEEVNRADTTWRPEEEVIRADTTPRPT